MRPITKIRNEVLTKEECDYLENRAKKLLLYSLLTEFKVDILRIQRVKYSAEELKRFVIQLFREETLKVKRLKRQNRKQEKIITQQGEQLFGIVSQLQHGDEK